MLFNEQLMVKAAQDLEPTPSHQNGYPVYFLTGKKYIHQTLFCIRSLVQKSSANYHFVLIDDGSFDLPLIGRLKIQLPDATLVFSADIDKYLEINLPANLYPNIHRKRSIYPHLKKLTDIHILPGNSWKIVLDSDMLFWDEPKEILNWLENPDRPIHMVDCTENYGYSNRLMKKLAKAEMPRMLNVGIIGLNSGHIGWDLIEYWIGELENQEGASYYLEQALSAMLIVETPSVVLSAANYVVNPPSGSITSGHDVLHHYVDVSKKVYFSSAWKKFI